MSGLNSPRAGRWQRYSSGLVSFAGLGRWDKMARTHNGKASPAQCALLDNYSAYSASGRVRRDFPFDAPAQFAVGRVQLVAGLQVDPEIR